MFIDNNKIKTPLTMNGKRDDLPTDLSAIDWQWNTEKGCFIGQCYHYRIAEVITFFSCGFNTIEWSVIATHKVTIYRANYQIIEGKYTFELTDIKSVHRAD